MLDLDRGWEPTAALEAQGEAALGGAGLAVAETFLGVGAAPGVHVEVALTEMTEATVAKD